MTTNFASPEELARRINRLEEEQRRRKKLPHLYRYPHYKWSREFFESTNRMNILTAANQVSKALALTEEIPTLKGFKTMGEISVGDFVFARSGVPVEVVGIPFQGMDEFFEIFFSDNTSIIASKDHEWVVKTPEERFRKAYCKGDRKWSNPDYGRWRVFDTKYLYSKFYKNGKASPTRKCVLPICSPVEYPTKELFDPYYVGLYIGNGSERSLCVNEKDEEVIEYCSRYGEVWDVAGRQGSVMVGVRGVVYEEMLRCGRVSYEKRIPDGYLQGSVEQRKALLAGLMDTDGTVDARGQNYSFCTTSRELVDQFCQLVTSLGGIAEVHGRGRGYYYKEGEKVLCREFWTVSIWTMFNPFRVVRKASRWKVNTRYKHERVIDKILPIGRRMGKCITVRSEEGSFLASRNYIVTHNSSTQIRKTIEWATNKDLWPKLWPGRTPRQMWYLYPDKNVATAEWYTKWEPEFMPCFASKEERLKDTTYGYEVEFEQQKIKAIWWNSGVVLYFKPYSTDKQALQSGSVDAIFSDEETPTDIIDELLFRLSATKGYFHTVFTATLNQTLWYEAIECIGKENEKFVGAAKWQISKYDCLYYEDGSPSPWTEERIQAEERMCSTEAEVQRRIYGRFVKSTNLCVPQYVSTKHWTKNPSGMPGFVPKNWQVYSAVDIGAGKATKVSHPAAIVFLAVNEERTKGRLFAMWRGDNLVTTCGDILEKYLEMEKAIKAPLALRSFDQASTEFFLIAQSSNIFFHNSNKARDRGFETLNTLFKTGSLEIDKDIPDSEKLDTELSVVTKDAKEDVLDDLLAACRYAVMSVPWDWDKILQDSLEKAPIQEPKYSGENFAIPKPLTPEQLAKREMARQTRERRGEYIDEESREGDSVEEELAEWNEYL